MNHRRIRSGSVSADQTSVGSAGYCRSAVTATDSLSCTVAIATWRLMALICWAMSIMISPDWGGGLSRA